MASDPRVNSFLNGNAKFAETFTPPPPLSKVRANINNSGRGGVVILTCSDPRVVPERFMPLDIGNPAVIRNAGGRAMDAMRTLLVLNTITKIGLVVVVHHTDCGTTHVSDNEVRNNIRDRVDSISAEDLEKMSFGEITDLEGSVREDVKLITDDALFAGKAPNVVGMVYDLESGKLRVVD